MVTNPDLGFDITKKGSVDCYYEELYKKTTDFFQELSLKNYCEESNVYKFKEVIDWDEDDSASWAIDITLDRKLSQYDVPYFKFKIKGSVLRNMTIDDFESVCNDSKNSKQSKIMAKIIYYKLQDEINKRNPDQYIFDLDSQSIDENSRESESSSGAETKPQKRGRGRPKGITKRGDKERGKKKSTSIPEFLLELLMNPDEYSDIIEWVNLEERKFTIVNIDEVLRLWKKLNGGRTNEAGNFKRSMRYYHKKAKENDKPKMRHVKRGVYQFLNAMEPLIAAKLKAQTEPERIAVPAGSGAATPAQSNLRAYRFRNHRQE